VKVQPKSRRPGLQGVQPSADGPRLRVGVTEAAEAGKANAAVCALIAEALGVPKSAASVAVGQTNREKTLHIAGDIDDLSRRLAAL